jgi:3-keto-5-aminohexanoate cleavage enzyme
MEKVVITCAVSGAETTREQNPNLPITPQEISAAAVEAYHAGASILHLHVRDTEGQPTQDVEVFRTVMELVRQKCDMVIEVSTGGALGMDMEERMQPLALDPEMATLDCGTVNFGDGYFVNTYPMMRETAAVLKSRGVRPTIGCFDLSGIDAAAVLIDEGLVEPPLYFNLVMNAPGATRFTPETLDFFVRRLPEGSRWTVVAIGGRVVLSAMKAALQLGGFLRVGLEDNVWFAKGELAKSNAQLVEQAAELAKESGREIASPDDVRKMLELS